MDDEETAVEQQVDRQGQGRISRIVDWFKVAKGELLTQSSRMNRWFLSVAAVSFASFFSVTSLQALPFTSFGSGSFTVDPGSTTATYTQDALGLTFSPSVSLGDTLGGTWNNGPFDWSSYADFASTIYLKFVFTGPIPPPIPMVFTIYNTDFSLNIQYEGTSVGAVVGTNCLPFALTPGTYSPAVLANVGGAQITWGGSGQTTVRLEGFCVPEPSTYALLLMAGAGVLWMARGRR